MPKLQEQTWLGFDYGTQQVGVAIANAVTRQARPLTVIRGKSRQQHLGQVGLLIDSWQPHGLVVGLPLLTDGQEQPLTAQVRRFARQLEGRFGVPVYLVNEWGSTRAARQQVAAGADDDHIAAAIILQRWLDESSQN